MLKTTNLVMLVVTALIAIVQITFWFNQLPDPMPSHFNGAGKVDGTMSKSGFMVMNVGLQAMFLIGFPLLSMLMKRMPDSMLNIPNKEYWLTPDRREQTLDTNGQFLNTIGWLSGWLMISLFHLTAQVAVGTRNTINPEFYFVLGIFLVAVLGGCGRLYWIFRIPNNGTESQPNIDASLS